MDPTVPLVNALQWIRRNRAPLMLTAVSIAAVGVFLWLFYFPPASFIGPEQPIPFSHRLHAGVKQIQCQYCHPYVGQSNHPGLPPVEKCLHCHNYIIANHWWIQEEHRYYNSNTPTPWVKANFLAEHVLFNHQRHIRYGIQCEACHGRMETMDRVKGKHFKMGFCVQCHQEKKVNLGCWLACHS